MPLIDNDRVQEWFLIIGDSFEGVNKRWLYVFVAAVILAFPLYFIVKIGVYNIDVTAYTPPKVLGEVQLAALEQVETGFVKVADQTYIPYVRVKNSNLDWGMPNLAYSAEIKSSDGTVLSHVARTSFVLPASEKYLVLSRFTSTRNPAQIDFSVLHSRFVKKPNLPAVNLEVQRTQVYLQGEETIVTAVIKNTSPFTVTQVDLLASVYNERAELVAINYTNINDLVSGELRSFQLSFPSRLPGQLRAEVTPEINVFSKDILKTQGGISPFDPE